MLNLFIIQQTEQLLVFHSTFRNMNHLTYRHLASLICEILSDIVQSRWRTLPAKNIGKCSQETAESHWVVLSQYYSFTLPLRAYEALQSLGAGNFYQYPGQAEHGMMGGKLVHFDMHCWALLDYKRSQGLWIQLTLPKYHYTWPVLKCKASK